MKPLFLTLALVFAATAHSATNVVATVNGEPIYESDLVPLHKKGESKQQTLEKAIYFRLAIQDAKRQKMDKKAEVKQKIDRVYYESFLDGALAKQGSALIPTKKELVATYNQTPRVRLRHLVLKNKTQAQAKVAKRALTKIDKARKRGVSFKKLVLDYSKTGGLNSQGILISEALRNSRRFSIKLPLR